MEFTWESLHCSWSLRGTWGHYYILTPHIPLLFLYLCFLILLLLLQCNSILFGDTTYITLKNIARVAPFFLSLSLQQLCSQNRYSFHWVNRNAGNWGNKLSLLLWIQDSIFLPFSRCNWSIIWFSVSGSLSLSVDYFRRGLFKLSSFQI